LTTQADAIWPQIKKQVPRSLHDDGDARAFRHLSSATKVNFQLILLAIRLKIAGRQQSGFEDARFGAASSGRL
jgi:hypothetical protein